MTGARDPRAPSLAVVAAGGVGVLVMLVFVGALALGTRPVDADPGERVAVAKTEGPAGLAVLVPRCGAERVVAVELRAGDGTPLWRITSRKGSIDRRYVVGASDPVPVGFDVEVPLEELPADGPLVAAASVEHPDGDRVDDEMTFTPDQLPNDRALYRGEPTPPAEVEARARAVADCGGDRDLDLPVLAFALAAAVAVAAYGAMVGRWWRART